MTNPTFSWLYLNPAEHCERCGMPMKNKGRFGNDACESCTSVVYDTTLINLVDTVRTEVEALRSES